jgi:hypothetical protein
LQLEAVEHDVAIEEERASLLRRLLDLDNTKAEPSPARKSPSKSTPASTQPKTPRMRLEDAVVAILSDQPKPVHIGEIRSKLVERGIRIPGKGTDSNIIARIIKEPRIERASGRRGFYQLRQS